MYRRSHLGATCLVSYTGSETFMTANLRSYLWDPFGTQSNSLNRCTGPSCSPLIEVPVWTKQVVACRYLPPTPYHPLPLLLLPHLRTQGQPKVIEGASKDAQCLSFIFLFFPSSPYCCVHKAKNSTINLFQAPAVQEEDMVT